MSLTDDFFASRNVASIIITDMIARCHRNTTYILGSKIFQDISGLNDLDILKNLSLIENMTSNQIRLMFALSNWELGTDFNLDHVEEAISFDEKIINFLEASCVIIDNLLYQCDGMPQLMPESNLSEYFETSFEEYNFVSVMNKISKLIILEYDSPEKVCLIVNEVLMILNIFGFQYSIIINKNKGIVVTTA